MKKRHGAENPHNKPHTEDKSKTIKLEKGVISTTAKGSGFVALNGVVEDILIEQGRLNTALNGDEVEIALLGKNRGRQTGEVKRIVTRKKDKFVGALKPEGENFILIPDDRKMYVNILIPKELSLGAKPGEKVQAKIVEWANPSYLPRGEVFKILGAKGNNEVEMHAITLEAGFEISFPQEVTEEAHALERSEKPIKEEEIAKRRDMRETVTLTIDPVDAKDFDDAISYKELEDGLVEIGVHIADVSHYVREGTSLDAEALNRGCSIYLVDRTIPMLPEVLSNDLCSLNPREDKLTFSSIFIMDKKTGEIKERWFGKTIINSNKRFAYEEAQETLNKQSGPFLNELNNLNTIAKILEKEKFKEGAINFEQQEVKFKLDENGKPLEVYRKDRLDTHKLVEEYMLLANREVAEFIFKAAKIKKGMVGIYRIHDVPQAEKIHDLTLFLKALGYDMHVKNGKITSKDINSLLKQIEGKSEESLIKTAMIRSMSKAVYSPSNIGHFGLAFVYYTHFTSPIRRYPDLLVHRVLQNHITDKKIPQDEFIRFKRMADQSSERELKAAEAERNSIKMKQVEYMSERLNEEFDGVISGVTEWGIYIEEANTKCEGMAKLRDMTDDYYQFNEKSYSITGSKTKKKLSLGDKVRFKVIGADVEKRTLDYKLV